MTEEDDDLNDEPNPALERMARNQRRYRRDDDPFPFTLPRTQRTAADLHFEREHDFVTPACVHRFHKECLPDCPYCEHGCRCVCHSRPDSAEG